MQIRRRRGQGVLVDEIRIGSMRQANGQAKQRIERRPHVAAPSPSEDEVVQRALQMRLADAVIGAERPPLEVGKNAARVRPGGCRCVEDFGQPLLQGASSGGDRRRRECFCRPPGQRRLGAAA